MSSDEIAGSARSILDTAVMAAFDSAGIELPADIIVLQAARASALRCRATQC